MSDALVDRLFGSAHTGTYHDRYTFQPSSEVTQESQFYTVIRVYDLALELPVTLKVYDFSDIAHDARELVAAMWQSEVRVLMQLIPYQWRRPGLVRFVEAGEDEPTGTYFVCWEDAYRATLADLLAGPKLAPEHFEELGTKVELMVMLVEALYELHSHGIIHREINPDVICVWTDKPSRAAFTQFGMSVFLNNFLWADAPDRFGPQAGGSLKAMSYWAPERLAFLTDTGLIVEPGEDYRQDFFSLGLAMTEWFTRPFGDAGERGFLAPETGYEEMAHNTWVINDVFTRLNETSLTRDKASEEALKELLFTMVQFHPDDRYSSAGELLRAARDVQTRWRERGYRDLCKRPFHVVFAIDTSAEHLDIGAPAERKRTELEYEEKKAAIQKELGEDLSDGVLQVGFPTSRDRYRSDNHGADRWFLRGRQHVYRLERFRSPYHQFLECPWIAYVHQVVRGGVTIEAMTTVPFERLEVVPLTRNETAKLINGGTDPGGVGRWDDLIQHVRVASAEEQTTEVENHVVVEALREVLELQGSLPDVATYCVEVVGEKMPEGPDGRRVLTLRYAPERDQEMVARHPYIKAFTRTREERRPFADWLRSLVDRHDLRVELAGDPSKFNLRRRTFGQLLLDEPLADASVTFMIALPGGANVPFSHGVIRAGDADGSRSERDRQARALERLEADRYRLELLREPAMLHVNVPRQSNKWLIDLDGDPDANKRVAVDEALTSHPAFFLQGPPGTGKTTTATELVAQILAENAAARILIAAQANEALDNLMEDVLELLPHKDRYVILRVKSGSHLPAHPEVRDRQPLAAVERLSRGANTRSRRYVEALAQTDPDKAAEAVPIVSSWRQLLDQRHSDLERTLYRSANLVFATCSGSHSLTNHYDVETFDWVIVEEAARAHATELLIPLMAGHRWVLIGDQAQLQPFKAEEVGAAFRARVRSRVERSLADSTDDPGPPPTALLERSDRFLDLFQHLFHAAPADMRETLTVCYRMHPAICAVVDRLFYRPIGADAPVLEPGVTAAQRAHGYRATWAAEDWLAGRSMVWLDTSAHSARREEPPAGMQTSRENVLEQQLISELLDRLQAQDRTMSFMLLSLYKLQQARLADLAAERENTRALTIMGAQGKQADVVILSLVRSNTDEAPGVALGSIRRDRDLNVALSRARRLLVLVGDLSHFERFGDRSGRIADLITVFHESPTEQDSRGAAIAPLDGLVEPGWLPE